MNFGKLVPTHFSHKLNGCLTILDRLPISWETGEQDSYITVAHRWGEVKIHTHIYVTYIHICACIFFLFSFF